jgi:hypothetical protein
MARLLDPDSDLHAQLEVLTSEGVATSAIEGERFNPNALRSSLARRLGLNKPPADVDGLVRAGLAHAWFELIHPFEDGNGRVGRALLDRALTQDENPRCSTRCSMPALADLSAA